MTEQKAGQGVLLLAGAFILVALNLRPGLSSIGPLLPRIMVDLGLVPFAVSFLTMLPVLCLGLFGQSASWCSNQFGLKCGITALLLILIAGLALRFLPMTIALYAGTILVGAAIGMIGVLMPVVARLWFPDRIGLMMGVYTMSLCAGAASGAGFSEPLALLLPAGWPAALAFWALPAIAALLFWSLPQDRFPAQAKGNAARPRLWRNKRAWEITGFMATQSSLAFITFAWLPVILQDRGLSALQAGGMTSLSIIVQAVSALLVPTFAARHVGQSLWAIGIMSVTALGFLGAILAPLDAVALFAILLGLGQGGSFALALTFILLRTATPPQAAALSAMVQSAGSLIAAAGPFLAGSLREVDPSWQLGSGALVAIAALAAWLGARAGRPGGVTA